MRFFPLLSGVLLLNAFAFVTIKLRPGIFGVKVFKPMLWNFKLSIMPLLILLLNIGLFLALSFLRAQLNAPFILTVAYILFFVGLLIWLLFLPNSGYLITELNLTHRDADEKEVPIWYDIVSVLCFALSGIVNTLANIVIVQLSFLVAFDPLELTAQNYIVLFLSGFVIIFIIVIGIYLGRALRLNSWDVLHPGSLFRKLKVNFQKQGSLKEFALYIVINTIFFMIMYISFGVPFYFVK